MKTKVIVGVTLTLFLVSMLSMVSSVSALIPPSEGDIVDDDRVDMLDVVKWALAFGSQPGDQNWDPDADINSDGIVDIFDGVIIGVNFGRTDP